MYHRNESCHSGVRKRRRRKKQTAFGVGEGVERFWVLKTGAGTSALDASAENEKKENLKEALKIGKR